MCTRSSHLAHNLTDRVSDVGSEDNIAKKGKERVFLHSFCMPHPMHMSLFHLAFCLLRTFSPMSERHSRRKAIKLNVK